MADKNDAVRKHSRTRTWFQAAWFALTNGYFRGYTSGKIYSGNTKILCVPGLNCYSCPGALAACPIGALQAVLNKSSYRVSLYVFGLLGAFGVLFGRLVCGWMCPFGLVQDLIYKIKIGNKKKNLPGHAYLRWLRFAVLGILVLALPALFVSDAGTGQPWFCEWLCPSGTLLGAIPLVTLDANLRSAIGFRFFWKLTILIIILVGSLIYYRPFCKYLCPLGAIYGLLNPVSTYRIEVDTDKCIKCHACQRACGMDIATFQTPNSMDCIRCGDCMSACPTGALQSTWGKIEQRVASRCFIDDMDATNEASEATTTTNPELKLTIFLGIMMIIGGGASAIYSTLLNLYSDFTTRMEVAGLAGLNPGSLILGFCKVTASLIILITGIYLLINRNNVEKVKTAGEKARIAHIVYFIGIVGLIVGSILDLHTLSLTASAILTAFYCLLGIPVVRGLARALNRRLEGKPSTVLMWLMAALVIIVTLAQVSIVFVGMLIAH